MVNGTSSAHPEDSKVRALEQKVQSLEQQLDWFKRQLFGRKSEKRLLEPNPEQPLLDGFEVANGFDPLRSRQRRFEGRHPQGRVRR